MTRCFNQNGVKCWAHHGTSATAISNRATRLRQPREPRRCVLWSAEPPLRPDVDAETPYRRLSWAKAVSCGWWASPSRSSSCFMSFTCYSRSANGASAGMERAKATLFHDKRVHCGDGIAVQKPRAYETNSPASLGPTPGHATPFIIGTSRTPLRREARPGLSGEMRDGSGS